MATRTSSKRRAAHTSPRLKKATKALGKRLMPRSRGGKRAMAIGLGLAAVLTLTIGLVAESALSYTVTAMSSLGALAVKRAEMWQAQQEEERRANRAPRATPQAPGPQPAGSAAPPPQPGRVMCTETGQPVDQCGCSSRHVATAEGAERYGRPVGSPIGQRRSKAGKPASTTRAAG